MTAHPKPKRPAWRAVTGSAIALLLATFLIAPVHAQTLGDAAERAWSRNPQFSAIPAREAEAQARAELAAGVTPGPPALSLSSLSDRLNRNRGKQEWELEMAVPLWLPGQKAAREHEAERAVAEVAARREALRLQVAGEVRDAWWAVAAARNALDLAKRRVATARSLEADVLRRFKLGDLARVDANLARNETIAAENDQLDAGSALRQAEQAYRALTGIDAPQVLSEEKAAPRRDVGETHPQLVAAIAAAEVARGRLKVAEETRREAPELAVRVVRDRGEFGEAYANTIGVKVTVPFSSGARVRQENAGARAEAAQADAELLLARQRVQLDLAKADLALEAAEQQLGKARERRELTADNLRLAEKSFALGESDLPSVLKARSSAFEAEAFLDRQRIARAVSVSRLNQALGVLP